MCYAFKLGLLTLCLLFCGCASEEVLQKYAKEATEKRAEYSKPYEEKIVHKVHKYGSSRLTIVFSDNTFIEVTAGKRYINVKEGDFYHE